MSKPKPYEVHEMANKCSAVEITITDDAGDCWQYKYIDEGTFTFGKEDTSGKDKIKKYTLPKTKN